MLDYDALIEKLKQMYAGLIYLKSKDVYLLELPLEKEDKYLLIEKRKGICYISVKAKADEFCLKAAQRYNILIEAKTTYYQMITSLDDVKVQEKISQLATFKMLVELKSVLDNPEFIEVNYVNESNSKDSVCSESAEEIEHTIKQNMWVDSKALDGNKVYTMFSNGEGEKLYFNLLKDEKGVRVYSSLNFECVRNSRCFEALMSYIGLYVNDNEKRVQSNPKFIDLSIYYIEDIIYYIIVASNIDLF